MSAKEGQRSDAAEACLATSRPMALRDRQRREPRLGNRGSCGRPSRVRIHARTTSAVSLLRGVTFLAALAVATHVSACAHGDVFAAQRSELRDAQPGLDAEQHQGATGDLDAARDAWQEALDILDRLGLGPRAGLGAGYPDPESG